ncbi:MAG: TolC family protein [Planctomycetes bacterium]|nr:TolC family protein [Planctomycetota bacterium]
MALRSRQGRRALGILGILGLAGSLAGQTGVPGPGTACPPPVAVGVPLPAPCDRPLPINLPTALQLAGARPLDIAVASERVRVAAAQLERARVLWLPTVYLGVDYLRHDGQIQQVAGDVFTTSRGALMFGAGPSVVFAVSDALFEPLAARQVVRAQQAALQTAINDSLLAVAEAYFNVQQARGELAGAQDVARRATDLLRRVEGLARGLVPEVEKSRARAELARRRQVVHSARERWRIASAGLTRVLRLDPAALVEPLELPHLTVTLVHPAHAVDNLIPIGLSNRPELAAQQALVQATLERLRAERLRPLVPSVLLRGASTNPAGTLAGGYFGGGRNDFLGNFSARSDFDIQVLWELQNLGFDNRARVSERRAENEIALLELFRTQDRVAAEVAEAHAQVVSAADRLGESEGALKDANDLVERSVNGLGPTQRVGERNLLIIRPQEVVAAVQALSQAYGDYYGAVADYNRAQFRLYRALGQPAQAVLAGTQESRPAAR